MFYEKYIYFSRLIYDNKNTLFQHDELYLFTQKFIRMHMTELHLLNKYTTSRAMLYNDFKNKSYEILLRSVFCNDIKNHILSFIY